MYKIKLIQLTFCHLLFSATLWSSIQKTPCPEGIVTLTFDNGYLSHYETVLPLMERYGLSATFYVTTSLLGQPGYLTPEQVIELSNRGHEIASHGATHRNLKRLSSTEVEQELQGSKLALENLLQRPVFNFAPPYGASSFYFEQSLKKYYHFVRTTQSAYLTASPRQPIPARIRYALESTTPAVLEAWINQAIAEKKWLILIYHHIDDPNAPSDNTKEQIPPGNIVSMSVELFESHLKLLHGLGQQTQTIKEVLNF